MGGHRPIRHSHRPALCVDRGSRPQKSLFLLRPILLQIGGIRYQNAHRDQNHGP